MDIEGLEEVEQFDTGTGTVTCLYPHNCGPRHVFVEVLSSGTALIELREGDDVPGGGPGESLHVSTGHDLDLMERLIRAMNVVVRDAEEKGLPSSPSSPLSMLCMIPGRSQIRLACENLATAFEAFDTRRAFKVPQQGDPSETFTRDIVCRNSVVTH